jgi:hypothetical protein
MNIKKSLLAVLCVVGMVACGGGTAVSPTLPSSQTQLDNLNAKYDANSGQSKITAVPGTSTESIQSIFMDQLKNGSQEIIADVVTYYYRSFFLQNAIATDTAKNVNGSTTISVYHPAHGLHIGDKVSVKNASQNANGIAAASLNNSNPVTAVTSDGYQLVVQGSASQTGLANINVSVDYQIVNCIGKYNSIESVISEKIYSNTIENQEVFYSALTVAQLMRGCTPEFYGENVTKKFYKKISVGYELVAQSVAAGDYSMVCGTWKLPSEGLSATSDKLAGDIGKLINYADTRKLQNNGYTLVSYQIAPDTVSSVFLIISLKNYTQNNTLMTTETNIYGKAATGYQLIKRQIDYNNDLRNRIEIFKFVSPPEILSLAKKNGFSDDQAAEVKRKCNGMMFLSCARNHIPLANLLD